MDSFMAKLAELMHQLMNTIPIFNTGGGCSATRVDAAKVTSTKLKALDQTQKKSNTIKPPQPTGEPRFTEEQVNNTRRELTQNRLKALSPDIQ